MPTQGLLLDFWSEFTRQAWRIVRDAGDQIQLTEFKANVIPAVLSFWIYCLFSGLTEFKEIAWDKGEIESEPQTWPLGLPT